MNVSFSGPGGLSGSSSSFSSLSGKGGISITSPGIRIRGLSIDKTKVHFNVSLLKNILYYKLSTDIEIPLKRCFYSAHKSGCSI